MKRKGFFVTFEGVDGSGKGTQLKRLFEYIISENKYQDVLRTREQTWRAKEIKKRLESDGDSFSGGEDMAKLYVADRKEHAYGLILPSLEQGVLVLCDRYAMSTLGHQGAQGVELNYLIKLHRDAKIPRPDLTLFMDVSPEIAKQRAIKRGEPLEKFEKDEKFFDAMVKQYRHVAKQAKDDFALKELLGDVAIINADQTEDEVFEEVKGAFDMVYDFWKAKSS